MVAKSLTPETALRPAQTGQPVLSCNKELTTLQTGALNSCLQSGQTNHAILLLPADTSFGEQAFLLPHMLAAAGHLVAKSLIPETTFKPRQTGQPVR